METKKFRWETIKGKETGRDIKIRVDENGERIPKAEWDNYSFVELPGKVATKKAPQVEVKPEPIPDKFSFNPYIQELLVSMNDTVVFKASIEDFPFCCGMLELGNFRGYDEKNNTFKQIVTKDAFKNTLDKAIKHLLNENVDNETSHSRAIVTSLLDEEFCNVIEQSFERTGDFTLIKQFVNSNSGNHLNVYISNN